MIISEIQQGSPEWLKIRIGKLSASNFSRIITATGKPSSSADAYINQLIAELLTGETTPFHQTEWMARGSELEPMARANFSLDTGLDVLETGFIMDDTKSWGCSPDGLIAKDSGLEIKCPKPETHIGYWRNPQSGVKRYMQQIQGCMLVTGRSSWWFYSFHPDLKGQNTLVRVERDEEFIQKLYEQLLVAAEIIKTSLTNLEKAA